MSFDIDDRLKKVFLEKIDDEEEYDDQFVSELEPTIKEPNDEEDLYRDDGEEHYDWTNIPEPKKGKTFADLKVLNVLGPPMLNTPNGPTPADPLLQKGERGYDRTVELPHGGRVTSNMIYGVVDKDGKVIKKPMHPDLAKQYTKYTDEEGIDYFKRTRNSIDKEYLTGSDGSKWYFNDIVSALKPNLKFMANKMNTPTFSKDEAILAGMEGIQNGWMTDLGKAKFSSHIFPQIKVAMADAASKSSNVSGIETSNKGTRDPYKASQMTTSADAPVGGDEAMGTFASRIPKDATSGDKIAKDQTKKIKLLDSLFNSNEIGLSQTERIIMKAIYGIKDGQSIDPKSPMELSKALNVSNVRISQLRKKAFDKIQSYMQERGYSSPEEAMAAAGLEEARMFAAAMVVFESMKMILELELELLQEYQEIPIDVAIGDVIRHAKAKVYSDTLSVDDVVAEGGESILGKTSGDYIREAAQKAATKLSKKYYAETVSTIIQMQSAPILGIIDLNGEVTDIVDEKKDWIQNAIKRPGALKAKDPTPDTNLTDADLDELEKSGTKRTKQQVNLARNLKKMH